MVTEHSRSENRNLMTQKLKFLQIYRPFRFIKPEGSFLLLMILLNFSALYSQNKLQKQLSAEHIETITINGNQIFNISVMTAKTDVISISSILDGEYQNNYQITTKQQNNQLTLSLAFVSFDDIPDDKRNAHKVIAATLYLEIPEDLVLNIKSDVGSVDLNGNYNSLTIELLQGYCTIKGNTKRATVNTFDGNISVVTKNAKVNANSNHGKVSITKFKASDSIWNLQTINGDITVVKQE